MSQAPVRAAQGPPASMPPAPSRGVATRAVPPAPELAAPSPSRTPQLLQRLQVVVALAVLIAGAMSAWVIADLYTDLADAPNLAQQYARLGQVQHDLSDAARLASTSVILGEAADGENATAALDQVVAASGLLVEAAKDRPQDTEALQAIGGNVLRYSLALSSAMGTPRAQALPRLSAAETQLDDLLVQIDQLQAQLTTEAAARPWSQGTPAVWLVGLVMAGVVVWVSWVVALRSHRVLNLGVAGAGLAVLIVIGITAAAQASAGSASDASRSTQFDHVVNATTAVRHLDAAHLVLTNAVLTQTWDAEAQAAVSTEYQAAVAAAQPERITGLGAFNSARNDLADRMAKPDWKAATNVLTDEKAGSLWSTANNFRNAAGTVSASAVSVAAAAPANTRAGLVAQLVFVIALSLAGAALGALGLYQRLREYR